MVTFSPFQAVTIEFHMVFFVFTVNISNQLITSNRQIPDANRHANASGINTFQQKVISWSTRRRGKVHRTHICASTKPNDLNSNQKTPQMFPVVQVASSSPPIFGNGVFQPPRNKIVASIETRSIIAYSARKINAKRIPPYSTWNPATSSDSASGISNGARLHSASEAMK